MLHPWYDWGWGHAPPGSALMRCPILPWNSSQPKIVQWFYSCVHIAVHIRNFEFMNDLKSSKQALWLLWVPWDFPRNLIDPLRTIFDSPREGEEGGALSEFSLCCPASKLQVSRASSWESFSVGGAASACQRLAPAYLWVILGEGSKASSKEQVRTKWAKEGSNIQVYFVSGGKLRIGSFPDSA